MARPLYILRRSPPASAEIENVADKPCLVNPAGPSQPNPWILPKTRETLRSGAAKEKNLILVAYSLHVHAAIGRLGILDQFFVEALVARQLIISLSP